MKKFLSLALGLSASVCSYTASAACDAATYAQEVQSTAIDSINGISYSVCGHDVEYIFSGSDNPFDFVSTSYQYGDDILLSEVLTIKVDGEVIFEGDIITTEDYQRFAEAIGFGFFQDNLGSASLASSSSSFRVSDTIYTQVVNPITLSKSEKAKEEKAKEKNMRTMQFFMADLKYERAKQGGNDDGNIVGFTAGVSYDLSKNISLGVVLPYDYIDFNSYQAHRTGLIGYVKHTLKLAHNFELSNTLNTNYIFTSMTPTNSNQSIDRHTGGGGFSTRLSYDSKGAFVPAAIFSIQHNQDDSATELDNQTLVKLGSSLSYRIGDNAVIQVSGAWNKNITEYSVNPVDDDFFDIGGEVSWKISEEWQLKGGYKTMQGLKNYQSNSFYIGSTVAF